MTSLIERIGAVAEWVEGRYDPALLAAGTIVEDWGSEQNDPGFRFPPVLRSAALAPSADFDERFQAAEDWMGLVGCVREVENLVARKVEARPRPEASARPGKILRFVPRDSLQDWLAYPWCGGLIDQHDWLAWDLWLGAVVPGGWPSVAAHPGILAWIPQDLVGVVDTAMEAQSTDCYFWVEADDFSLDLHPVPHFRPGPSESPTV